MIVVKDRRIPYNVIKIERSQIYAAKFIKAVFVLGENHFRKYFSLNAGVWLVRKIEFFINQFHLTVKKYALTAEIHFRSYFHFKWFPERERERERKKRVNPELQSSPTIAGEPRAPVRRSHTLVAPVSSIAAPRRSHRTARSHEF